MCTPVDVHRRFGGTASLFKAVVKGKQQPARKRQAEQLVSLVTCLAYFSTLKMKVKCSSETSVTFYYPRR
jgi:hypothetical protein